MQTALVTGASTGIGQATAIRLASLCATVVAGVRDPDGVDDLRAALAASNAGNVEILRLDVDSDESVAAAVADAATRFGPIDVLVNNAGVSGAGSIEQMPLEEFRRQMETNVFGLLRCTQAVLPSMRERRSGAIVNIGSLAGRFVRQSMGAYAATKHAVEAITDALAQEVAPFGIRVAVVEPGVVRTAIWGKAGPSLARADPAGNPYALADAKTMAYFGRILRGAIEPSVVADVVVEAITADSPLLRYPVGWDAETILAARRQITDEEMVAMAALDLDAWKASWADAFGFSLE